MIFLPITFVFKFGKSITYCLIQISKNYYFQFCLSITLLKIDIFLLDE